MYFHMLQQKEKKKLYLAVFSRETAPRECVYVCVYVSLLIYHLPVRLSTHLPSYLPIRRGRQRENKHLARAVMGLSSQS